MDRESSPGDKKILEPTIPGSQGQASSIPMHSVLRVVIKRCIMQKMINGKQSVTT